MSNRVVITGIGICSPVGGDAAESWRNMLDGRSGIGPITLFDAGSMPVRIGGEVKGLDPARFAANFPEAAHESDRKIRLGLTAASQALREAALAVDALRAAWVFVGVSLESFLLDKAGMIADATDLIDLLAANHPAGLQTPLDPNRVRCAGRSGLDRTGRHVGMPHQPGGGRVFLILPGMVCGVHGHPLWETGGGASF